MPCGAGPSGTYIHTGSRSGPVAVLRRRRRAHWCVVRPGVFRTGTFLPRARWRKRKRPPNGFLLTVLNFGASSSRWWPVVLGWDGLTRTRSQIPGSRNRPFYFFSPSPLSHRFSLAVPVMPYASRCDTDLGW